jgi:glycosyltransferase involved in cell wall biosynthesis
VIPRISIVIPTYNRRDLLSRTLPCLLNQTGDISHEIIFVDDGSTDNSADLIRAAAAKSTNTIRYIQTSHTGSPSHARNVGIQLAVAPVILLLDDDVMPAHDLVAHHVRFHDERPALEHAALGYLYLPDDIRRNPMSLFHCFPYEEAAAARELSYLFFWTCNISVKRSFLLQNQLFDEDPQLHPVEDMEFGYRLSLAGMKLTYLPKATGAHLHNLQSAAVPRKGERTGRAQFALMRKVPDTTLLRRFGILSPRLHPARMVLQTLRRSAFRFVDNPLTLALLRLLGAEQPVRSRVSDLYYYLIFRRNMVLGFKRAKRESRIAAFALHGQSMEGQQ